MSEDTGKEILRNLVDLINKATGIPVFVIDHEMVNKLTRVLEEAPEIKKNFSSYELSREVSSFIMEIPIAKGTLEEKVTRFLENLLTEKNYTAFVMLKGLRGYPIGMKLGEIEFVEYSAVPEELVKHISFLKDRGYKFYPELDSWIRFKFSSYKTQDLWNICAQKLELPLAILSLISMVPLDLEKTVGVIFDADKRHFHFLSPFEAGGWSKYDEESYGSYMGNISKLLLKETKTSFDKRILRALRIFGLARLSKEPEIKFLFNVAALESLLLTKNDRDYLGYKLAEKTAFLLGNNFEERMKIYRDMKRIYGKRSALIHGGEDEKLSEKDEHVSEMYVRSVIFKLLELLDKYTKMECKSSPTDQEGLEDFLNALKFS